MKNNSRMGKMILRNLPKSGCSWKKKTYRRSRMSTLIREASFTKKIRKCFCPKVSRNKKKKYRIKTNSLWISMKFSWIRFLSLKTSVPAACSKKKQQAWILVLAKNFNRVAITEISSRRRSVPRQTMQGEKRSWSSTTKRSPARGTFPTRIISISTRLICWI